MKLLRWTGSFLWSVVNFSLRTLVRLGWIRLRDLGVRRVIGVGNLQAAGAGKTPLVMAIAREAVARGEKVCILSRGYGGRWEKSLGVIPAGSGPVSPADCGDEVALMHQQVSGAWFAVGGNRIAAFEAAREKSGGFDCVILDDAFQNWKIRQNVKVLAVTSLTPGEMWFRDFLGEAARADLLVWTKGSLARGWGRKPEVRVKYRLNAPAQSSALPLFLVTGVGDARSVRDSIVAAGWMVAHHVVAQDHAEYTESQILRWADEARVLGAQLATTGKDFVKWSKLSNLGAVQVFEPELEWLEGRAQWEKTLWG